MTTVTVGPEEFRMTVRDHSGFQEVGKDIVCAGASTLAFALINAATDKEEYMTTLYINEREGVIEVRCYPDEDSEDQCREMFRTVIAGYEMLADTFPDNVRIK